MSNAHTVKGPYISIHKMSCTADSPTTISLKSTGEELPNEASTSYIQVRQGSILSMRRYYAKNREKELQRFKAYNQKDKERIREYKKRKQKKQGEAVSPLAGNLSNL
ncbi:Aste57867_10525 [Aphanomyces stellatus]|uniref:Aste57867_10525 protein n=1 Tax=Aphanomyces stellatus TaxID=120398 RepID=A0A485KR66_9STRA|nr:hypothetical protein As57867_010485 [Aphanomyces stellatus]VFT87398.1 Aste57867_10525 [Aphanomyces stellatus]